MRTFAIFINFPSSLGQYVSKHGGFISETHERHYRAALLKEIAFWSTQNEWRGRKVSAIYFGGAQAASFGPNAIRQLLFYIGNYFPIDPDVEITFEFGRAQLALEKIPLYVRTGINRVSFRADNLERVFADSSAQKMRIERLKSTVTSFRSAGIKNVGLDLGYGARNEEMGKSRETLKRLLDLKPEHVSIYYVDKAASKRKLRRSNSLSQKYLEGLTRHFIDRLIDSGYGRYHMNHFALPSAQSRYNSIYWRGGDYIGLGAGAHSRYTNNLNDRLQWFNFEPPRQYIDSVGRYGCGYCMRHILSFTDQMFEFFSLGLRNIPGVRLEDFDAQFGFKVQEIYPGIVEVLRLGGLLKMEYGFLSLTERGFLACDQVIENFVYDKEELPKHLSVDFPPYLPTTESRYIEAANA